MTIHPFVEVIVILTPEANMYKKKENLMKRLFYPSTSVTTAPLNLVDRKTPGCMDICYFNVNTWWFMITNAYYLVSDDIALLFTHDHMSMLGIISNLVIAHKI